MREDRSPKVSVIVVNAKGVGKLEECLRRLMRTRYPNYEVIVVDCLTPNIRTWIREFFPNVKVIHYDHDIGASDSHNIEKHTTIIGSKYLAFLDNDAYTTENWLTELVKVMENDEKTGTSQAKILMTGDNSLLDHTGVAIDAVGTWHTTRGLKADDFKDVFEIFAASSAGCIVRRKVFDAVGGFDPDYFIYDDDTDFSFRVRLLGYKIVLVPSAVVIHDADTSRTLTPTKLYHSVKNRTLTMLKNYEIRNLWWRFSLCLAFAFLTGIGLVFMRRTAEAKAMFRSMMYPLTNMRKIWTKRASIQSKRRIRDSELFHKGLLRNDIYPTLKDAELKLRHLRE